jgi:hypothetical protein
VLSIGRSRDLLTKSDSERHAGVCLLRFMQWTAHWRVPPAFEGSKCRAQQPDEAARILAWVRLRLIGRKGGVASSNLTPGPVPEGEAIFGDWKKVRFVDQ